ncbi:MAG: serine protease [Acidimicrobiales bacterium]
MFDLAAVALIGSIALQPSTRIPTVGDPIVAIGHPGGHGVRRSRRLFTWSPTEPRGYEGNVLLFEAELVPGFSGGPVIDQAGEARRHRQRLQRTTWPGVALLAEDVVVGLGADNAPSTKSHLKCLQIVPIRSGHAPGRRVDTMPDGRGRSVEPGKSPTGLGKGLAGILGDALDQRALPEVSSLLGTKAVRRAPEVRCTIVSELGLRFIAESFASDGSIIVRRRGQRRPSERDGPTS